MIFKNELPLNHEPSLNNYAQKTADTICELADTNWDYEYETCWNCIEHGLENEGLEWRTNDGVWQ